MSKVTVLTDRKRSDGRDAKGRFTVGNRFGRGRPARAVEDNYLLVITSETRPEAWRSIVRRAINDAQKGEPRARDWLSRYLLPSADALELGAGNDVPVIITLPDNRRGPRPGESREQYEARMKAYDDGEK